LEIFCIVETFYDVSANAERLILGEIMLTEKEIIDSIKKIY